MRGGWGRGKWPLNSEVSSVPCAWDVRVQRARGRDAGFGTAARSEVKNGRSSSDAGVGWVNGKTSLGG